MIDRRPVGSQHRSRLFTLLAELSLGLSLLIAACAPATQVTGSPEVSGEALAKAVKAVEDTARLLRDLGHHVEEAAPSLDMMAMSMDWLGIWFTKCASEVARVKQLTGCGDEGFELDTLAMVKLLEKLLLKSKNQRRLIHQQLKSLLPIKQNLKHKIAKKNNKLEKD